MRKVYTIGETIYDIIFSNGLIKTGKPGGSMLNTSVSLGRLGIDVHFISECGSDDLGEVIVNFLIENHVDTSCMHRYADAKTALAIAFLDNENNARYNFYRNYPKVRLPQPFPDPAKEDIVIFGSYYSLNPEIRESLVSFLRKAKQAGAVIIYDPNIRKPHQHEIPGLKNMIHENFMLADIVRGSKEDFEIMFETGDHEMAFRIINNCSSAMLVFTSGSDSVYLHSPKYQNKFDVPRLNTVSTIGAGDTFNAGIAYSFIKMGVRQTGLQKLNDKSWNDIITTSILFSQEVCKSYDNYMGIDFAEKYKINLNN